MHQNKLLCYKLCYCLGVADETLQGDFAELHTIAKEMKYFEQLKTAREFRAIARIYYTVVRHCELYTKDRTFSSVAGPRFKSYLEGTNIEPEIIYQDSSDVLDFINKLSEMSHQMLPTLYNELKPAVDYLSFEMLMNLKALTDPELQKVHYILRRLPVQYNIYFFASDLFNVALRDMLKTDAALRKCISIVTARPLDKSSDTSTLAKELDTRDDGYFVVVASLVKSHKNLYLIQKEVPADQQAQILALFSEQSVPVTVIADQEAFVKLWQEREDIHTETAVIVRPSEEELAELQESCPGLNQVMLIPIARNLYRKILSGEFSNVSLLSLR